VLENFSSAIYIYFILFEIVLLNDSSFVFIMMKKRKENVINREEKRQDYFVK